MNPERVGGSPGDWAFAQESRQVQVNDDAVVPIIGEVARKFLRCGDLHFGFARVRCGDCGHEMFVPFSCRVAVSAPTLSVSQLSSEAFAAGRRHDSAHDLRRRAPSAAGFYHSQTASHLLSL